MGLTAERGGVFEAGGRAGAMCAVAVNAGFALAMARVPPAMCSVPVPSKAPSLQPAEVAMVGDRIYTDIAMAGNAACLGGLVLSGEATRQDADASAIKPDVIVENLAGLGELLDAAQPAGKSNHHP
jgi:NagD protein